MYLGLSLTKTDYVNSASKNVQVVEAADWALFAT